MQNTVMF